METGGGKIFRTRQTRPWVHAAFCVMNISLFPEGKADEAWP